MNDRAHLRAVELDEPPFDEMPDRLMRIEELEQYLDIPKKSIYDLVYRRAIPHTKIGQRLRFRKSAIDEWIDEQSREVECV